MPEMAALAETLAVHLGTPFLRADFFVGSPKWGVRLNEVAYGCGLEYRNFIRDGLNLRMIDDKPAMAEILRQGMNLCHQHKPPQHFLRHLGVQGNSYEDTAVVPLSTPLTTFSANLNTLPDHELADYACEESLCSSVKELPLHDGNRDPSKENKARQLESVQGQCQLIRNAHLVKPHPAHIPTLLVPKMAAVMTHPHLIGMHIPTTSLKAPLQVPCGYVQASGHMPRAPAMLLRAPLR